MGLCFSLCLLLNAVGVKLTYISIDAPTLCHPHGALLSNFPIFLFQTVCPCVFIVMTHRFHGVGSVLEGDLLQDVTQGPSTETVKAFSSLQSLPETHTWMEEACLEDGAGRCAC